jgi:hypothetical protein
MTKKYLMTKIQDDKKCNSMKRIKNNRKTFYLILYNNISYWKSILNFHIRLWDMKINFPLQYLPAGCFIIFQCFRHPSF